MNICSKSEDGHTDVMKKMRLSVVQFLLDGEYKKHIDCAWISTKHKEKPETNTPVGMGAGRP